MTKALQTFHLFVENAAVPATSAALGNGARSMQQPESLEIPSDCTSYLIPDGDGHVRVSSDAPGDFENSIVFETVRYEHRPYLSALFPENLAVRVNGLAPPPLAILRPRDVIEIGGQHALHVSLFTRPHIGPPPEQALGKECPVCLTPIAAQSTVYVCPFCQAVLHAGKEQPNDQPHDQPHAHSDEQSRDQANDQNGQPDKESDARRASNDDTTDDAAEDQLECVRLSSSCPRCEQPIVLTEGYTYVPEL